MNNAFERDMFNNQKTTIRPKGAHLSIQNILAWEPTKDEAEQIYRASVPLAAREKGHKINPLASEEAKIQSLAMMGSNATYYSAVGGSETMDIYAFDYWQYIDSLVFWESLIPTPDVIDSSHRNGVPIYGTIFFNWSTAEKDRENVRYFLQQDKNDNYLVADKLVDIAKYYGFDGYFINQETAMPAGEGYGQKFRDFLLYLKEYAKKVNYPIHISWYDAMDNDGPRAHYDAINSNNDLFVSPSEENETPTDEFFINFNWGDRHVNQTAQHMTSIGRSPYDAYAGLELQAGGYYHTNQKRHALTDENGQVKLSIGLFIPDSVLGIADGGEDYHIEAKKFWTGFDGDPKTSDDSNDWSGMSRFVVDKTPIINPTFQTYFNAGHGKHWFVDGEIAKNAPWNSRGIQDIMPTWRWWIDNTNAMITGRYDFDDAFNGGTSLTFEGDLARQSMSDIMLYSTDIKVSDKTKLKVTAKANHPADLQIGLSTDPEYSENSFTYYDLEHFTNWESQEISLADLQEKAIAAIKLRIQSEDSLADYKLNLGQLSFYNHQESVSMPKNVDLLEHLFFNAQNAEAMIKVDPVAEAKHYEVYQLKDEQWEYINASHSNYIYLPSISRSANAEGTDQQLKVVALGKNGLRSEPKLFNFEWGMETSDTTLPKAEPANIMTEAEVTSEIEQDSSESTENILSGTIDGTSDKWYSASREAHVDIQFSKPRTVIRWVVDHAGAGGEAVGDGSMNTKDFNLEYKNAETGEWEVAKAIRDNIAHTTDVILDEPITATEWRLNILTADNGSPWGGIRIYNWKMYESYSTESKNLPMATAKTINIAGDKYSVALANGIEESEVSLYSDRQAENKIAEEVVNADGNAVFHHVALGNTSGYVYYRAKQPGLELSYILAIPYQQADRDVEKVDLVNKETIEVNQIQPLDLSNIYLTITYSDGSNERIRLSNVLVDVTAYDEAQYGKQTLPVSYAGIESVTPLTINFEHIDFDQKAISSVEITELPKRRYLQGDTLDLTDGLVTINYEDGFEYDVSLSNADFFDVSELDSDQIGKQTITVTHRGHEASFDVVVEKEAVNLQRLQQLTGQVEALQHDDNYHRLSDGEKQAIDDFIRLGQEKIADKNITQEEVDHIVASNIKLLQEMHNKLA